MIKTVLVPSLANEADPVAFAAAAAVARGFAAHIDVLHVRLDPVEVAVGMTTDTSPGTLVESLVSRLETDAREREAKAHEQFAQFCARENLAVTEAAGSAKEAPSASWHVEIGQEPGWIATYGIAADLVVVARGKAGDAPGRANLEAVLVDSGRPLLVPTPDARSAVLPERIAIAWKATPQAARAVAAALPLLERAKQIRVLSVAETGADTRAETERLVRYLAWHGLTATVEALAPQPQGAAAPLFAAARDTADLLVMGGYGHSRLREWVFGGFTQQALAEAPLPVLIAH